MKKMKKLGALLLTAALTASLTVPTFAATYNISELDVDITYSIEAGSDEWSFDVSCSTAGVDLDEDEDVTVTNAPDEGDAWGDNIKPKATIILRADSDDDYRFSSIDKTDVTITGDTISKYTVSDTSKKVTITVTLPELEYEDGYWDDLLEIDEADWGDANGIAHWSENEDAKYYEIKAYRGSSALTGIVTTTDTEYDLSQYFTRKGDYMFKVRACYSSTEKGAWVESDEYTVDADEAEEIRENGGSTSSSSSSSTSSSSTTTSGPSQEVKAGEWLRDSIGWWWCNADRTYPSSTWKLINNKWYYFNDAGYCVLNTWVQTNGLWYYCGPDGDMWVNRRTPDNYWVNANGVWVP